MTIDASIIVLLGLHRHCGVKAAITNGKEEVNYIENGWSEDYISDRYHRSAPIGTAVALELVPRVHFGFAQILAASIPYRKIFGQSLRTITV